MPKLEEVYKEIEELKLEKKELSKMFKDEVSQHERHQQISEELKALREEKKSIEREIQSASLGSADRLSEIASEIKALNEVLSDVALNMYMQDETVEVVDQYDNKYIPVFTVKFKKAD